MTSQAETSLEVLARELEQWRKCRSKGKPKNYTPVLEQAFVEALKHNSISVVWRMSHANWSKLKQWQRIAQDENSRHRTQAAATSLERNTQKAVKHPSVTFTEVVPMQTSSDAIPDEELQLRACLPGGIMLEVFSDKPQVLESVQSIVTTLILRGGR